jgi:hypothetical protein
MPTIGLRSSSPSATHHLELLSARERLWARTRVAVPAVLLFSTLTLAITSGSPFIRAVAYGLGDWRR